MKRTPIAATAVAGAILIFTPLWAFSRLGGEFEFTPADGLLLMLLVVWVLVARALLDRDNLVLDVGRGFASPAWRAAALIDESALGVGTITYDDAPVDWHRLQAPLDDHQLVLAPPILDIIRDQSDELPATQAILPDEPEADLSHYPTFEYTVVRGDTYWSIAEAVLADGRRWTELQKMNLGREVAPGVELAEGDDLRIGWVVVLPLTEHIDDKEHDDA